jgi:Txe/YoeB family toxin of Txe-Axe toxin-antitoxin module
MRSMKCKVVFADEKLKRAFDSLNSSKTEDQKLYKWLNRAFDDIARDAFSGIQIPKRLIPRKYIEDYEIDNLWKYNLPNAWRLLYSVARDKVIVISVILEWLPHKEYERRFKY